MRPSLQAIIEQATGHSDRLVSLLGVTKISEQLRLPASLLDDALAHPVTRRRLACTLADRFGFAAQGSEESLRLLPSGRDRLECALMRFSLATALSAHPAVFRRDHYRSLADVWGDRTLLFALRHRPTGDERDAGAQLPLDRDAALDAGRILLVNSLKEPHPAVAAVLALVYDVDLASEGVAPVGLGSVAVAALRSAETMPEPAQSTDESIGHS